MDLVQTVIQTKMGPVSVLIENGKAIEIALGRIFEGVEIADVSPFKEVIEGYFKGKMKEIDFPVEIKGTDFQKKVWEIVRKIPYGTVTTYGKIAKIVGTSPRAVGMAMRTNRLPLYIPCHRVVSKDGIGGFSTGIDWKEFLLELEGVII